jgi:hypothetical protein
VEGLHGHGAAAAVRIERKGGEHDDRRAEDAAS